MPTTSQGIWYPGETDPVSPLENLFATMAASIDANMGIRIFPTTTARNNAYAQTPFKLAVVGADFASGTLYRRDGTNWTVVYANDASSTEVALNVTAGTPQYNPTAYKVGQEVQLTGAISGTVADTWTSVAVLPVGYRPAKYQYYPGLQAVQYAASIRIQLDGTIQINKVAGAPDSAYVTLTGTRFLAA